MPAPERSLDALIDSSLIDLLPSSEANLQGGRLLFAFFNRGKVLLTDNGTRRGGWFFPSLLMGSGLPRQPQFREELGYALHLQPPQLRGSMLKILGLMSFLTPNLEPDEPHTNIVVGIEVDGEPQLYNDVFGTKTDRWFGPDEARSKIDLIQNATERELNLQILAAVGAVATLTPDA